MATVTLGSLLVFVKLDALNSFFYSNFSTQLYFALFAVGKKMENASCAAKVSSLLMPPWVLARQGQGHIDINSAILVSTFGAKSYSVKMLS